MSMPSGQTEDRQFPDLAAYHRTFSGELESVRDRVRSLVRHWPTDGAFKEDLLKAILRRHLPESLMVGRGFVVSHQGPSTEIDVLIIDRSKPTLFKADDLLIVTPDAVRAIIEVKTRLDTENEIQEALTKLARNKALIGRSMSHKAAWAGLFVYEGTDTRQEAVLRTTAAAYAETGAEIDAIAYGANSFMTFIDWREVGGAVPSDTHWRTGTTSGLAPSVFMAYLLKGVEAIHDWSRHSHVWFPPDPTGRWTHRNILGESNPTVFPVAQSSSENAGQ